MGHDDRREQLDEKRLEELRTTLRGDVVQPGDAGYDEEARRSTTRCTTGARR